MLKYERLYKECTDAICGLRKEISRQMSAAEKIKFNAVKELKEILEGQMLEVSVMGLSPFKATVTKVYLRSGDVMDGLNIYVTLRRKDEYNQDQQWISYRLTNTEHRFHSDDEVIDKLLNHTIPENGQ